MSTNDTLGPPWTGFLDDKRSLNLTPTDRTALRSDDSKYSSGSFSRLNPGLAWAVSENGASVSVFAVRSNRDASCVAELLVEKYGLVSAVCEARVGGTHVIIIGTKNGNVVVFDTRGNYRCQHASASWSFRLNTSHEIRELKANTFSESCRVSVLMRQDSGISVFNLCKLNNGITLEKATEDVIGVQGEVFNALGFLPSGQPILGCVSGRLLTIAKSGDIKSVHISGSRASDQAFPVMWIASQSIDVDGVSKDIVVIGRCVAKGGYTARICSYNQATDRLQEVRYVTIPKHGEISFISAFAYPGTTNFKMSFPVVALSVLYRDSHERKVHLVQAESNSNATEIRLLETNTRTATLMDVQLRSFANPFNVMPPLSEARAQCFFTFSEYTFDPSNRTRAQLLQALDFDATLLNTDELLWGSCQSKQKQALNLLCRCIREAAFGEGADDTITVLRTLGFLPEKFEYCEDAGACAVLDFVLHCGFQSTLFSLASDIARTSHGQLVTYLLWARSLSDFIGKQRFTDERLEDANDFDLNSYHVSLANTVLCSLQNIKEIVAGGQDDESSETLAAAIVELESMIVAHKLSYWIQELSRQHLWKDLTSKADAQRRTHRDLFADRLAKAAKINGRGGDRYPPRCLSGKVDLREAWAYDVASTESTQKAALALAYYYTLDAVELEKERKGLTHLISSFPATFGVKDDFLHEVKVLWLLDNRRQARESSSEALCELLKLHEPRSSLAGVPAHMVISVMSPAEAHRAQVMLGLVFDDEKARAYMMDLLQRNQFSDALHFVMTSEPARVSQLFPQLLSYCSSNSQIEKFLAALPSSQGDELLELLDMQPPSSVVAECELRLMRARDLELQIIQLVARTPEKERSAYFATFVNENIVSVPHAPYYKFKENRKDKAVEQKQQPAEQEQEPEEEEMDVSYESDAAHSTQAAASPRPVRRSPFRPHPLSHSRSPSQSRSPARRSLARSRNSPTPSPRLTPRSPSMSRSPSPLPSRSRAHASSSPSRSASHPSVSPSTSVPESSPSSSSPSASPELSQPLRPLTHLSPDATPFNPFKPSSSLSSTKPAALSSTSTSTTHGTSASFSLCSSGAAVSLSSGSSLATGFFFGSSSSSSSSSASSSFSSPLSTSSFGSPSDPSDASPVVTLRPFSRFSASSSSSSSSDSAWSFGASFGAAASTPSLSPPSFGFQAIPPSSSPASTSDNSSSPQSVSSPASVISTSSVSSPLASPQESEDNTTPLALTTRRNAVDLGTTSIFSEETMEDGEEEKDTEKVAENKEEEPEAEVKEAQTAHKRRRRESDRMTRDDDKEEEEPEMDTDDAVAGVGDSNKKDEEGVEEKQQPASPLRDSITDTPRRRTFRAKRRFSIPAKDEQRETEADMEVEQESEKKEEVQQQQEQKPAHPFLPTTSLGASTPASPFMFGAASKQVDMEEKEKAEEEAQQQAPALSVGSLFGGPTPSSPFVFGSTKPAPPASSLSSPLSPKRKSEDEEQEEEKKKSEEDTAEKAEKEVEQEKQEENKKNTDVEVEECFAPGASDSDVDVDVEEEVPEDSEAKTEEKQTTASPFRFGLFGGVPPSGPPPAHPFKPSLAFPAPPPPADAEKAESKAANTTPFIFGAAPFAQPTTTIFGSPAALPPPHPPVTSIFGVPPPQPPPPFSFGAPATEHKEDNAPPTTPAFSLFGQPPPQTPQQEEEKEAEAPPAFPFANPFGIAPAATSIFGNGGNTNTQQQPQQQQQQQQQPEGGFDYFGSGYRVFRFSGGKRHGPENEYHPEPGMPAKAPRGFVCYYAEENEPAGKWTGYKRRKQKQLGDEEIFTDEEEDFAPEALKEEEKEAGCEYVTFEQAAKEREEEAKARAERKKKRNELARKEHEHQEMKRKWKEEAERKRKEEEELKKKEEEEERVKQEAAERRKQAAAERKKKKEEERKAKEAEAAASVTPSPVRRRREGLRSSTPGGLLPRRLDVSPRPDSPAKEKEKEKKEENKEHEEEKEKEKEAEQHKEEPVKPKRRGRPRKVSLAANSEVDQSPSGSSTSGASSVESSAEKQKPGERQEHDGDSDKQTEAEKEKEEEHGGDKEKKEEEKPHFACPLPPKSVRKSKRLSVTFETPVKRNPPRKAAPHFGSDAPPHTPSTTSSSSSSSAPQTPAPAPPPTTPARTPAPEIPVTPQEGGTRTLRSGKVVATTPYQSARKRKPKNDS